MGWGLRKVLMVTKGCGLFLAFFAVLSSSWAQTNDFRSNYNPAEFKIYRPLEFFREFKSDHYPELKDLTPEKWDEIRYLFNNLQNNGVAIGIGTNSNNHTIFELYLPLISRPDGLVGPTIGVTKESRVGNLYFLEHDAAHHAVGIPGPRLKDLDDLEAAKAKLTEIMLLKEQVATIHSMSVYIPKYWNWRDQYQYGQDREAFQRLNHGMFSMGNLPRDVYADMIGHFVHGRSFQYFKILAKYVDPAQIRAARRVGVPLAGPHLHPYMGIAAESYAFKVLVPLVEPILARYREVGYQGFLAYSKAMAEFMLQPWYVEWADRFDFGIPLDDLKKRSLQHIEDYKAGKPIGDFEAASNEEFDRKALMNEVALFGRRVAELREMGRRGLSKPDFDRVDDVKLAAIYESAAELHDSLRDLPPEIVNERMNSYYRTELTRLMGAAERLFPLSDYLPVEHRQPFINYDRYWRDITGLAVPRYGHNSGALSATDMKRFIMERRASTESFYKRMRWTFREWLEGTQIGKPDIWRIQNEMADDYERYQDSQPEVIFEKEFSKNQNVYLKRMDDLSRAIRHQINDVLIPQVTENRLLDSDSRSSLIWKLRRLDREVGIAISRVEEAYKTTFILAGASKGAAQRFMARERRLNIFLDKIYFRMFDLARGLQTRASASALSGEGERLIQIIDNFQDLSQPFRATPKEDLTAILPNKTFRWQALADGVRTLIGGKGEGLIDSLYEAVVPFRFMRSNGRVAVRLEGWKALEAPGGNAHFILNLNHDQGLLEINMAYAVFEQLGVERIYTLTTKKAWSLFPKGKIPGENVVYIEDGKPIDTIVERIVSSGRGRVGILVCPEGILPSMAASTPIAAKPGAFVLARKLAIALKEKIPVYNLFGVFNGHEHYTSETAPPVTLTLEEPHLVPTTPLTPEDLWVEAERVAFENLVNKERVIRQPDLNRPRKASSTDFPVSGPLKSYASYSRWFNGSRFSDCAAAVRKLHGLPEL